MGTATLAIDIGGTGIKASVIDDNGEFVTPRVRLETPIGAAPQQTVVAIAELVRPLGHFDRVAAGFPGVVRDGHVLTAHNLGNDAWLRFDLAGALTAALGRPTRVANDADLHGLAVISGK